MAAVGLPGARLINDRADRALDRGLSGYHPRDLVFADPPYAAGEDELGQILAALADRGWLAPDALVALERDTRSGPPPWPQGYAADRSRRYGETTLWYGRAAGDPPAETASTTGA
jgi:16S rRNA (guanine966-N2)-methyltransferase